LRRPAEDAFKEDDLTISLASKEDDLTFILLLPLFVFRAGTLDTDIILPRLPLHLPNHEVKEEEDIQAPRHRCGSNGGGITIREPKVEVKEEDDDDDEVAMLLYQQCLTASSDNHVHGGVERPHRLGGEYRRHVALSIRESGRPLIDHACDNGKAGPSSTVKKVPTNERIDPRKHLF
jgi:hypothetical protein